MNSQARAQQSGTLLSQTLTIRRAATDPTIGIQIAGGTLGKSAPTTTKLIIDIGPDGNAVSLPPDPALPATFLFRLTRTAPTAGTFDFPTAGATTTTAFSGKAVALVHGLENTADPRGLFALAIVHPTGVAAGAVETYTLELVGLPTGLRVVASIDQGTFTSVNVTGACGTSCPAGQSCQAPCPATCPAGQSCRGACPRCPKFPCSGPILVCEIPQMRYPPGPWPPCLSCPREWFTDFDRTMFDRVMVSFRPTDEQYRNLQDSGRADFFRFDVDGGRPVGGIFEGADGAFMQLMEYPKGQPPSVVANAAGVQLAQFRAEPTIPGAGRAEVDRTENFLYGLGGLRLGALGTLFGVRRRPAGPGPDRDRMP
jgi:hypothetical protein